MVINIKIYFSGGFTIAVYSHIIEKMRSFVVGIRAGLGFRN